MKTTRITIAVASEQGEAAATRLMEEEIAFALADEMTIEKPPSGHTLLTVFAPPDEGAQMMVRLRAALDEIGVPALIASEVIDDAPFRDAWKEFFKARPVGPFVIVPSWEAYQPKEGETTILLDPGRAFGTGGHASTRLCLRAIGRLPECKRFLDVGCGSGILAIACARRWPSAQGVAIDNDPEAVAVARENAENNGVIERIQLPPTSVAALIDSYDLVLANLQADIIFELAEVLAERVAPGGRLVVSGVLASEAVRVTAALVGAAARLELSDTEDEDEWRALVFTRPAA